MYFSYPLEESTIKLELESNENDTKEWNEILWKRVVPKPLLLDKRYAFNVDYNQLSIGTLYMSIEHVNIPMELNGTLPHLYRLNSSLDTLDTISVGIHLNDTWDTLKIYLKSLLNVIENIKSEYNLETKSPFQRLIRDSFLRGLHFRQQRITCMMEFNTELQVNLKEKLLFIQSHHKEEERKSTLYWNFPFFKRCRDKKSSSQESHIYKIYVHQAINELSHQFDRVLFDFEREMEKIHLAATLHAPGDPSAIIVQKVVSNIILLCIKSNDLVMHILSQISKDQDFMDPIIQNITNTLGILQFQILPQLENQRKRESKLGLVLKNAFQLLQELIEKMKRLLSLQGMYLLNNLQNPNEFIPKPWWSELVYDSLFIQLVQVISMTFHKSWRTYLDNSARNPQFWRFMIQVGYPLTFYSQVIPDEMNVHVFDELNYQLNQLERNLRLRFHSDAHSSHLEIKMDLQSIILSFPISSSETEILSLFSHEKSFIPLNLFLILPKKPKYLLHWSDPTDVSMNTTESHLYTKSLSINKNSLKSIKEFIKKIQHFSLKKSGIKPFAMISSHLQSHLNSVESGILGTDHTFYFSSLERDVQITLLTSRLFTFLSKNTSHYFYKSSSGNDVWASIWIQNETKEAVFTLQDADFLFEHHHISLDSSLVI